MCSVVVELRNSGTKTDIFILSHLTMEVSLKFKLRFSAKLYFTALLFSNNFFKVYLVRADVIRYTSRGTRDSVLRQLF